MTMHLTTETLLRLLADDIRLRCVSLLCSEDGLSLTELTHVLRLPQAKLHRHLSCLQLVNVITRYEIGYVTHFRMTPDLPAWAKEMLYAITLSIAQTNPFIGDRIALSQLPNRCWPDVRYA
ncbi:MAG TPA: winged helix-turn-helix domain-containing protein [Gammaproteobacteria bacterium]|nr:winged helix-turn-helix domain-containing protein [Gammaproteobacteria bacterium]